MLTKFIACMGLFATSLGALAAPPVARREVVVNEYHGVKVEDPYQWLEDWSKDEVKAYSEEQNAHARAVLDALPGVEGLRARLTEVMSKQVPTYSGFQFTSARLFCLRQVPPAQQPTLMFRSWPSDAIEWRPVLDLMKFDPTGSTTIDWYVPSSDGRYVAVSLSKAGSEMGDVHFIDVASGNPVFEVIERVNGGTAGGSLAWLPDNSGVFYTRYPREGERAEADLNFYVQVYFHELGTSVASDRYELGNDFPRIAEVMLEVGADGRGFPWVLASVQNGDGGEFMHFVRGPDYEEGKGGWGAISRYEDRFVQMTMGNDGFVYAINRKKNPNGALVRMALKSTRLGEWQLLNDSPDGTFVNDFFSREVLRSARNVIYAEVNAGGPNEVHVLDKLTGKRLLGPEVFAIGAAGHACVLTGDQLLFADVSYIDPPAWKIFEPAVATVTKASTKSTQWGTPDGTYDLSAYEVVREFAQSKDGTKVPLNIIRKKGAQVQPGPALLSGYGGYGISITPSFNKRDIVLLEKGFVLAEANLRGGGEFGDDWHRQGNLTNKQNVFDDFIACAEHLIARGYASPKTLAIEGGSNGGLLMGAAFTQRPDLFAAVVSHVGIYDMLRVELTPNGQFNITEFGTVKNPDHFAAMHAYSPYHAVREGQAYPRVLLLTGANDPRVDPAQSRKMTAKLQSVGAECLLRTSSNTGHGAGTPLNARIEQAVDVVAFLCDALGVKQ